MSEAIEAQEKWVKSAEAWIEGMRRGDVNRTHLMDAAMLDCIGDVDGLRVIDIGCGEGRFSRMLGALGAKMTGIDLTPALIAEAKRLDDAGDYYECSAESLPFESDSFDIAVSYIVLIDVPDFRSAIREMARVTKPGGKIVVSNLTSFASTSETGWHRDSQRNKIHFPVDRYFEERALRLEWSGISILNWHRPMEAYMTSYLESGLILKRFIEPKPTTEAIVEQPKMIDQTRVPFFDIMVWQKPKAV